MATGHPLCWGRHAFVDALDASEPFPASAANPDDGTKRRQQETAHRLSAVGHWRDQVMMSRDSGHGLIVLISFQVRPFQSLARVVTVRGWPVATHWRADAQDTARMPPGLPAFVTRQECPFQIRVRSVFFDLPPTATQLVAVGQDRLLGPP